MSTLQTSETSVIENPVAIVGAHYCSANPVELTVFRKVKAIADGDFVVKDVNGKIVFKVREVHPNHHMILLDRAGNPIITLRKKVMTAHHRWQVFKGESIKPKDNIFCVKSHSMLYLKAKLDVFLAAQNTTQKTCDFKIRGSYAERSSVIHVANQESTILAQMEDKKHKAPDLLLGREDCSVMISPNVDYAFIMSLIVILDQIDNEGRDYASSVSHATLPILVLS